MRLQRDRSSPGRRSGPPGSPRPGPRMPGNRPGAPSGAADLLRPDAGHAARRARLDNRRRRTADHHRRPARAEPHRLGHHRLPPRRRRRQAGLREDRRAVRPQAGIPVRHRHLPGRPGGIRTRALDEPADRVPRSRGGRRRADIGAQAIIGKRGQRAAAGQSTPAGRASGRRSRQPRHAPPAHLIRRQDAAAPFPRLVSPGGGPPARSPAPAGITRPPREPRVSTIRVSSKAGSQHL